MVGTFRRQRRKLEWRAGDTGFVTKAGPDVADHLQNSVGRHSQPQYHSNKAGTSVSNSAHDLGTRGEDTGE